MMELCWRQGGVAVWKDSKAKAIWVHSSLTKGLTAPWLPTHSSGRDCMSAWYCGVVLQMQNCALCISQRMMSRSCVCFLGQR